MTALARLSLSIAELRAIATPAVADYRVMPFGVAAIDERLQGGLRAGALHEIAPAACSFADDAAATLFLAGVAAREVRGPAARCCGRVAAWTCTRQAWRRQGSPLPT